MVAKINYGNSLYGALAYNGEKVNEGVAKILDTNKVFSPVDGTHNISACMQDFMAYMPSHVLTKKPVIHISLNPHPDDTLTDEQFSAIAREYIEKMGYANQPFIVYKHEDIDRHHLHIVTLAVDERGKKINDGNNFYTSTRILKELEQKYGLIPAQVRKEREAFRLKKVCYGDGENLKKQLASVIKPAAKFYHCPSFKEYRALLSTYNICVEEVKGEVNGKTYMGLLYFATDNKGNKVGKVFKSSLFGKSVGYEALQNRFKASKEKLKEKHLAPKTKAAVVGAVDVAVMQIGIGIEDIEHGSRDVNLGGRRLAAGHVERQALGLDLGDLGFERLDGGIEFGGFHLLVDRLHGVRHFAKRYVAVRLSIDRHRRNVMKP